MTKLDNLIAFNDINEVKVVTDKKNDAIYFSRHPIPYDMSNKKNIGNKQVCIIPFRRNFLKLFNSLKETDIEISESIDMLRLIYNGYKVRMVYSKYKTYSVDTKNDLMFVQKIMKTDKLIKKYKYL